MYLKKKKLEDFKLFLTRSFGTRKTRSSFEYSQRLETSDMSVPVPTIIFNLP